MLHDVLRLIEQADGPVLLGDLSRQLGVAPSALQGMIEFWVRKGRLQVGAETAAAGRAASTGCAPSCCSTDLCVFTAKMPKTYTLRVQEK